MEIKTPYYIVDEGKLRRNLALISSVAENAGVEIVLAMKAFALWKVFPMLKEYVSHTTASGEYEARLSLEQFGARAYTYSPAFEEHSFDEVLRCSEHITFNSMSQFDRFADRVLHHPLHHSLGLRVNPEYSEIETEIYNPCAPGSRFGVLASELPEQLPEGMEGMLIHCHCESGADVFVRTLAHIEEKFSRWFPQLKWINFGGGHLMTRKDYDVDLLTQTLRDFRSRYPYLSVILEPGSAFAWQTGELVASVVDVVTNKGIRTAVLNVSFTCHMPDCLEMPYHPEVRGGEIADEQCRYDERVYRLGGNSCLSGDFMGYWRFPDILRVGDKIVFEDMIHYTTVKTNMFNGVHHPSILMRKMNGEIVQLREFSYQDFRDRMD